MFRVIPLTNEQTDKHGSKHHLRRPVAEVMTPTNLLAARLHEFNKVLEQHVAIAFTKSVGVV